ncbi:MAG TPA: hypothetical protein VF711_05740, partial [Acidimicrobiales bacterium]
LAGLVHRGVLAAGRSATDQRVLNQRKVQDQDTGGSALRGRQYRPRHCKATTTASCKIDRRRTLPADRPETRSLTGTPSTRQ